MAGHNRHLRGEQGTIIADVHGNTTVEPGDLMFIDATSGVRGASATADNYVYPFNLAVNSASPGTGIEYGIYNNFAGVAMEGSAAGVTEKITIATEGVFRLPLYAVTGTTIGALVSSVSTQSSASGVSKDAVIVYGHTRATTAYLGYVVKTESGASFVDFEIRTKFTGLAS